MKFNLKQKIFILFIILILLVGIDQWTKALAVEFLKDQVGHSFLNGVFQVVYAENPGAFLGMGSGWSRGIRFLVFGVAVVIGLSLMLWSVLKDKISNIDFYAYLFILSGGVGNVIDRLTHDNGHVVDFLFIDLQFLSWLRTGVFNFADVYIVMGVLIALWPSVAEYRARNKKV